MSNSKSTDCGDLVLCVFIDALGYRLAERHDFLDDVLVTRRPLETVLGYSCCCDPTILSGAQPRDHGHFSFFFHNPSGSPFGALRWLSWLPEVLVDRGRVRNAISRVVGKILGFKGYFQLYRVPFDRLQYFDYSEKRDLYEPGGINSGLPTIFDYFRIKKIPYAVSDWRRPETENLAAMHRSIESGRIRFGYLYLAGLDAILHAHGTRSEIVTRKIRWYEHEIRELLRTANCRYRNVHLRVFSDHGMTDVRQHLDLITPVENMGLEFGGDYIAMYDSTMARFWFLSDRARAEIPALLRTARGGRILSDAELQRYGCDFPDRRYGELIFLADPGVLIYPNYMGRASVAGMHGYDPDHEDSVGTFGSNDHHPTPPRSLQDLYRLMRESLAPQAATSAARTRSSKPKRRCEWLPHIA